MRLLYEMVVVQLTIYIKSFLIECLKGQHVSLLLKQIISYAFYLFPFICFT